MLRHPVILAAGFLLTLTLPSSAQEKVEDLHKRLVKLLSTRIESSMVNTPLEDFASTIEILYPRDLAFFIDVEEVRNPAALKITAEEKATLEEVLKSSLKGNGLIPLVWDGIVVVTTEKAAAQFKDVAWSGLTEKALAAHPKLREKLSTVYDFDWSPFDPRKGLETLSRKSGVAVDAQQLPPDEARNPDKHLLFPRKVALRTALICLARAAGITYEVAKGGSIIAVPAKKRKGAHAPPAADGAVKLALSLTPGDRFSVTLSERLGSEDQHHFIVERVMKYRVADVSAGGIATLTASYRRFRLKARAQFDDKIEPEDIEVLWEDGEYKRKTDHPLYGGLVEQSIRGGFEVKVDRRGRARLSGPVAFFGNLEIWGAGLLLGLPTSLPESEVEVGHAWSYSGKTPPTTTEGRLVRMEGDVAVCDVKFETTLKHSSGRLLETTCKGEITVRFDAKRSLPVEMKGVCRLTSVRNATTTVPLSAGSDIAVEATVTADP